VEYTFHIFFSKKMNLVLITLFINDLLNTKNKKRPRKTTIISKKTDIQTSKMSLERRVLTLHTCIKSVKGAI